MLVSANKWKTKYQRARAGKSVPQHGDVVNAPEACCPGTLPRVVELVVPFGTGPSDFVLTCDTCGRTFKTIPVLGNPF